MSFNLNSDLLQSKRFRKLEKSQKKVKNKSDNDISENEMNEKTPNGCPTPTHLAARGVHFASKRTARADNLYPTGTKLVLK